jgi:hypothetical protein
MNQKIDEMRPEYPKGTFQSGVRGKYAERYREGINIVKLDPDVAAVFKTDEKVNEALRELIRKSGSVAQ